MKLFFSGMSQQRVAEKVGVDQSTVSIYASRFRQRAGEVGLSAASKEFGMFNEVDTLRSLSVELARASLTAEEAKLGLKIIRAFVNLGIGPEQHQALVGVCKAIDDPGFVQAALKLSKIEAENNISYQEALSRFENAVSQLSSAEGKLKDVQAELESTNECLVKRRDEVAGLEAQLANLESERKTQRATLKHELESSMKQLQVKRTEAQEVAKLKADLSKHGLDIRTLVKLAKEFGYGNTQS